MLGLGTSRGARTPALLPRARARAHARLSSSWGQQQEHDQAPGLPACGRGRAARTPCSGRFLRSSSSPARTHARTPPQCPLPLPCPPGPAPRSRCALVCSARSGGSVLDNPVTLPGVRPGKQTNKRRGPTYKVMLHNDNHNRREYVIATLMKVVKGMTVDDAATGECGRRCVAPAAGRTRGSQPARAAPRRLPVGAPPTAHWRHPSPCVCRAVMQVAHETGVAMVISCPQEEAETYCGGLRLNGLTSSIEPERC